MRQTILSNLSHTIKILKNISRFKQYNYLIPSDLQKLKAMYTKYTQHNILLLKSPISFNQYYDVKHTFEAEMLFCDTDHMVNLLTNYGNYANGVKSPENKNRLISRNLTPEKIKKLAYDKEAARCIIFDNDNEKCKKENCWYNQQYKKCKPAFKFNA